ncbi:MAG TPA: DUF6340 family protein [Puia sp.]|jgi:hypothetical protein|nr:DUF6340 family protein [Puia sp.]
MKIPSTLLLGIMVFCYSCSSTNLMSLSVNEPAPVSLPPNAKTAAVVNRSRAADDSRTVDAIHRTISLESKELQADGAGASLTGLTDALIRSNRFAAVKTLSNLDLRSYGAGVFPVYLSWDTVEKICRENQADVLFSLELFDADSKVGLNIAALNVAALGQGSNVQTKVQTGWRIYDPATRTVLDQYVIYRDLTFQGSNLFGTGSALLGRKEAVIKAGNCAGQDYVTRIIPYSLRVSRFYYVRGSGSFIVAKRMAQSGDWDEAAKLWRQETNNPSRKVAGRACYNMAIISEINGDLNGALQWARKAYEVYRTPYALDYVNILQLRQNNDAVLRSQTEVTSNQ